MNWGERARWDADQTRMKELEIAGWMRIARWKAWANALEKRMVKPVKKIRRGWYEWSVKGYSGQRIELKLDSEFELMTHEDYLESEDGSKKNDWSKVYYYTSGNFDPEGRKTGLWIESLKHPQLVPKKQYDPCEVGEWNGRSVDSFIHNVQERVKASFKDDDDQILRQGETVDTDVKKNCWCSMDSHMDALNKKISGYPYRGITLFYINGKVKHIIEGFVSPMKSWIEDDNSSLTKLIKTKGPFTSFYKDWMCEDCAPGDCGVCTCENKDEELGGEDEEEYDDEWLDEDYDD